VRNILRSEATAGRHAQMWKNLQLQNRYCIAVLLILPQARAR